MTDNAIEVNNVTMRFNLAKEKTNNLKEYVIKLCKGNLHYDEFYALRDVSFNIKQGSSVALIGSNGSGKSTLLKLISGIFKPYKGSIVVRGSISPLIELGAGFDYDLTARENVMLNCTVLGHTRKYVREHLFDIIDFAELDNFIDVPIKNFSSGMVARLGFSIATMLKPDILIIDEILGVGDDRFQKRCEQRMSELLTGGTTLLFVSHSLDQVKQMCKDAIWLDKGHIMEYGPTEQICDLYINRPSI